MTFAPCLKELRDGWFPHTTDAGLDRLINLLESGSPLLIHGAFTRAMPMGCLATHIAWHHPETAEYSLDAGIAWLTRVAGLFARRGFNIDSLAVARTDDPRFPSKC